MSEQASERYEVETTREGFKVTIRGAEICHVEAFGSDAQSQIDAAVKARNIAAALNALAVAEELAEALSFALPFVPVPRIPAAVEGDSDNLNRLREGLTSARKALARWQEVSK